MNDTPELVERQAVLDALHTQLKYPTEACAIVRSLPVRTPSSATPYTDMRELALEFLAVAHEGVKKHTIAVDIRTGNIGRQGVMWVETTTALEAIRAALLKQLSGDGE